MTRHDVYQPLLQRTVENHQVQHLVHRFDFGKESRIARVIVQEINAAIEQKEASLQIKRVRPFELFVRRRSADSRSSRSRRPTLRAQYFLLSEQLSRRPNPKAVLYFQDIALNFL